MHIAHGMIVVKIVYLYNNKDSINSRHSRNGRHATTTGIQQQQAFSNSRHPATAQAGHSNSCMPAVQASQQQQN
jgi:hypothetical protein